MATVAGCVNLSHSPFWNLAPAGTPEEPGGHFTESAERLRAVATGLAPDVVVVFGPDHARNLFYDCMPPFCIGIGSVRGVGDYRTPRGDLPRAGPLAREIFEGVTARGFDPAVSLDLGIDHGLTQVYAKLFPALDVPIVPIVVNSGCPPLPSFRRCAGFGHAVGEAIRGAATAARVLLVGSGGLSHWPASISAEDPSITPEWRDFLIHGRPRVAELEPIREARAQALAAGESTGRVNAEWDRALLERISLDPAVLGRLDAEDVEGLAGPGALEVRTWAAAAAAWGCPLEWTAYEPVPDWITGMGMASSRAPSATTLE
ncbi:2,3-dihydroxyphenylpropionate 1,2-dioxygenase [Amycolatopsis sp. NBC_00345]|uniref:DODA-type extradiol aromatic ring-opening family dioxygenase n=1 Tax=Amycolatopsis sp. NBC_00345 TaxID=2975955 RepID=UPI002E2570E3